ncbi:amidase [Paracoccus zeaxanthinifaciens]|uniref:amidase n=1 Tax=Paracoccus zeaxanthinifaciens TaxID=187400 RepID=UPI0003B71C2B|nr:amidase [Paracoccus zeaxanthinifaciens]
MTIRRMQARLATGEATAQSLASEALALAAGPDSPFSTIEADRALAQAAMVDRARAEGRATGPLAGIPLAHKDMFDRTGCRVGRGVHPSASYVATGTAEVLSRLDHAHAVDLGRLQMSEFAMGPTGANHHHPAPPNPVVPGAIIGGSSSGSGVAVAMGIVPAALGSDTGGSIRIPAACNGVVGFKPTPGRMPMAGVMPLSWTQDCVGPLAASVDCARRVLSVLTGGAVSAMGGDARDLRIGFDAGPLTDGIAEATDRQLRIARAMLSDAGHRPCDLDLGWLATLDEPANVIAMAEAGTVHADRLRKAQDSYGPQVRTRLAQAAAISAQDYLRALQIRAVAQDRMQAIFAKVDVIVTPMLPDVPPQISALASLEGRSLARMISEVTRFSRPASILGLPAISVPVARTDRGPISVQVIGPPNAEDRIADIAVLLEEAALQPA